MTRYFLNCVKKQNKTYFINKSKGESLKYRTLIERMIEMKNKHGLRVPIKLARSPN